MDSSNLSSLSGANWTLSQNSINDPESVELKGNILIPLELTEVSDSSYIYVLAYCIVFLVATSGNLLVLISLKKQYKTKRSRINLLLLHLSLADLIACCTLMPTEIFWRLTIQWKGGLFLCKLMQFLCAFGLYLSSLVLICVSVDRFFAIVFPLKVFKVGSNRPVKRMLTMAWIAATIFSVPQAVFFGIETHPEYTWFTQCVTINFLSDPSDVKIYSIFSVTIMYFLPLLVILCTYSAIIVKLYRKSRHSLEGSRYSSASLSVLQLNSSKTSLDRANQQPVVELRCSANAEANMAKAKTRTLLMTVVMVIAFVFCWSPYAAMTLWYMVDWKGAAEVDRRIQDTFFLMAVANSCINPFIYRIFMHKCGQFKLCCCNV